MLNDSILFWRQVLLLLFLGRPFSPRPSVISGGGDQKRESKGGWWAGRPILCGEGSPQETFSPAPPPALGSETVASLAGPAAAVAAKSLQSCSTLCDPIDGSPPGFPVPGILQARILEWVTISFSRRSSRPRDQTQVSHIGGRHFNL